MTHITRVFTLTLVILFTFTAGLTACAPANEAVLAITPEPTPTTTATPTATPSPTSSPAPSPTPSPTPMPIDIKIEKFDVPIKEANLYFFLNQCAFIYYKIGDECKITFFYLGDNESELSDKKYWFVTDLISDEILFSYDLDLFYKYGYGHIEYADCEVYAKGYLGKPYVLLKVDSLCRFEVFLSEIGIDVPETKYSAKISDESANGALRMKEYAEYLALVIPDSYCVFREDLVGQQEDPIPEPN